MYTDLTEIIPTVIQSLGAEYNNRLFVKREDLIPVSFGGNKARKALFFFEEIDREGADCLVTYGSSSSNHVRVVCNLAAKRNLPVVIISPEEASEPTFNSKMRELFGAKVITVPVNEVHDTIERELEKLLKEGRKPFFIPGGGHGNTGSRAYVDCYGEILDFEKKKDMKFDYIFFASGTGTTHAGLVIGKYLSNDDAHIVGISIARKNPRGRDVVLESIYDYLKALSDGEEDVPVYSEYDASLINPYDAETKALIEEITVFDDTYVGDGYGKETSIETIKEVLIKYGIPLDSTYTGKAWYGMEQYIKENDIKDKNILFIHTGGTPLFFDTLNKIC